MTKKLKLLVSTLVIILLITSISVLLASCDKDEPKDYGTFYTLQEAYDLGYIDMQDLKSIAYYHNCDSSIDEASEYFQDENFIPIAKNPEMLSEKKISDIVHAYFYLYGKNIEDIGDNASIHIDKYYGIYNGGIAIMFNNWNFPAITKRYVEGIPFWFSSRSDTIYIFIE